MAKYLAYHIDSKKEDQEILIAALFELGFESFIEEEDKIQAFISKEECTKIEESISIFFIDHNLPYSVVEHNAEGWNIVWESNFDPIDIGHELYVHAAFHPVRKEFKYQILISPKMAFGTGHHATTSMILEWMCNADFKGKDVLDFGCGTGILGIFAKLKNCNQVVFIDNEEPAIDNTKEHINLNVIDSDQVILGSWTEIPDLHFDVIFANITRNVILDALDDLLLHTKPQGMLIFSGFLESDVNLLTMALEKKGLRILEKHQKLDWCCLISQKN